MNCYFTPQLQALAEAVSPFLRVSESARVQCLREMPVSFPRAPETLLRYCE